MSRRQLRKLQALQNESGKQEETKSGNDEVDDEEEDSFNVDSLAKNRFDLVSFLA